MDRVAALLLAGGRGTGFGSLSDERNKAAFPVAGNYRIVDFALSNLSHAGVRQVGIVIQYMPATLLEHIGSGRPWEFDMADRTLRFMTPFVGVNETRWFRGTADAIALNLNLLDLRGVEHVLILSADHVYLMDYRRIVERHRATGADITMAYVPVDPERQHPRFGNLVIDDDGRVESFQEKPPNPVSPFVSMGIFCFRLDVLMNLLTISRPIDQNEEFSLAGHVLQPHVGRLRTQSWRFDGDWYCLAGLREYFDFHMRLAGGRIRLFDERWNVMTNFSDRHLGSRPPLFCTADSSVRNSIVSPGCRIEGTVENSVLSPGVRVGKGSVVRNSILLHDVLLEPDCRVEHAVVDKDARFGRGCNIGIGEDDPSLSGPAPHLTIVPKNYRLRPGQRLWPGADLESIFVR
jgi:glucose-1-phosphate adenylyltransferase